MVNSEAHKKRNSNIEGLRIVAMMMIIMLHALGKGGLLVDIYGSNNINVSLAWILEAFSIVAVNVYVLISGYVLVDSKFKSGRILEIVLQTSFYGIVIWIICFLCGMEGSKGIFEILQSFMPIHSGTYWFMTVYVMLYLLTPVLSVGVKHLTKESHLWITIILVIYECFFKSFLPVSLGADEKGMNLLWFIILFLIASYVKKYGFIKLSTSYKGIFVYLFSVIFIFLEQLALNYLYVSRGLLGSLDSVSYNYNHIFVLLASLGLFAFGVNKKEENNLLTTFVCKVAPYSLGVYLIHEHVLIRFKWTKWLGINDALKLNPMVFVAKMLFTCIIMFFVLAFADYLRGVGFRYVKRLFANSRIVKGLKKIDLFVNGKIDAE